MKTRFVENVYAVFRKGKVILATDNQDEAHRVASGMAKALMMEGNPDTKVLIKTYSGESGMTEFDIIENDNEQDYGYSIIYPRDSDDEYQYTMMYWKHRLPFKETLSYEMAFKILNSECTAYCADKDSIKELIDVHLDWWCQKPLKDNEEIKVISLPEKVLDSLLSHGFNAERLLVSVMKEEREKKLVNASDKNEVVGCKYCINARIDDELTDDNDFSSCTIGKSAKGKRMMLSSGWGKPLRIETEYWDEKRQRWETDGIYYPKYCPECGRKIDEYNDNNFKGESLCVKN